MLGTYWKVVTVTAFLLLLPSLSLSQISTHPVVLGRLGSSAVLSCHSNRNVPLRLCLWEQKQSDKLIATFDLSNFKDPGSADSGYSFHGQGLETGNCGIKIDSVKPTDLQRWKCTMLARDNSTAVFRGTVLLQGAETLREDSLTGLDSKDERRGGGQAESRNINSGFARPIVTAEGSVSHSSASQSSKGAPVQEVEVHSGGLQILPRRKGRKLVIL